MIAVGFQVFAEVEHQLDHIGEFATFWWVQIPDDIGGLVLVRAPVVHLVKLEGRQVGRPDQCRVFVHEDVVDILVPVTQLDIIDPGGRFLWLVLLEETLLRDPVGVSDEGERPPFDVPENRGSNVEVVGDHLGLDDSGLGIQHLFEIRDLELALAYLGELCGSGHVDSCSPEGRSALK